MRTGGQLFNCLPDTAFEQMEETKSIFIRRVKGGLSCDHIVFTGGKSNIRAAECNGAWRFREGCAW